MKRIGAKLIALFMLLMAMLSAGLSVGCSKQGSTLVYPDRGYATADKNSWEQIEEGDGEIEIDWFVNFSAFSNGADLTTKVGQQILKDTGIKINFISPIDDDGAQLSTMITGNQLPDIVTVGASSEERFLLASEGYVYPIDTLAEKYAPTLLGRIDAEIKEYFKMDDGSIYGLPNHFYSSADLEAYEQQEGKKLLSNGAIVARKDYLDAYIAHKKSQDPNWSDVSATTPEGFIEMCLWVKEEYKLGGSNPTVCLSNFTSTGSNAIMWLSEYFMVPKEDEEGNLLNAESSNEYQEMLRFLNRLYRENLITSGNLSANSSQVSSYISNGYPFVVIASPQDYSGAFNTAYDKGIEYVSILLTNSQGKVPQLRSLAGAGWLYSMISGNCERPDRVIKLFDYLMSEQGQSMFFGLQGEDFTYSIQPGETVHEGGKDIFYKYGKVQWTDSAWADIVNEETGNYGFMYFNMLVNPMYPRLAGPNGEVLNSKADYIDYNIKAPLTDYTYNIRGFEYIRDPEESRYNDMIVISTNLTYLWANRLTTIISAASEGDCLSIYNATMSEAKSMGMESLLAYDNDIFKSYKSKMGIQFAWPPNDTASGYESLQITSIFGNRDYIKEIPSEFQD